MFQTVPLSEQDYTNISRAVEALDGKRRKTENDAEKPHLLEQLEKQQQQQQQHRQNDDEFRHLLPQRGNETSTTTTTIRGQAERSSRTSSDETKMLTHLAGRADPEVKASLEVPH